jgi:tRNA threonylcarbamoyladenosine modification (KEOPS) complex  Pcc1 subunit
MKYHLSLTIDEGGVIELLEPELRRFESGRSTITLSKRDGRGFVEIEAEDATALRASMDSIAQLLKVYEKMRSQR